MKKIGKLKLAQSEIPHNCPSLDDRDIAEVSRSMATHWLASGPEVRLFEGEIVDYLGGGQQGVAVSSGTAALFLALYGAEIGSGAEVIIPTYSCSALLNAIKMAGAVPVPVDVDPVSWNISPEAAAAAITKNTRALIVTHTFGMPADMTALSSLGVIVIEDCAQAIGATIEGHKVGSIADISVFSFYATKMITTGYGGMIVSRNKALIERVSDYRQFDYRDNYIPRFNFYMADFQAALGRSQLQRLDKFIARRRNIGERYQVSLKPLVYGIQASQSPSSQSNGYRKAIVVEDACAVASATKEKGVSAVVPIANFELLHRYLEFDPIDFPVAEKLSKTVLSLPTYPTLTNEQVDHVLAVTGDCLN